MWMERSKDYRRGIWHPPCLFLLNTPSEISYRIFERKNKFNDISEVFNHIKQGRENDKLILFNPKDSFKGSK